MPGQRVGHAFDRPPATPPHVGAGDAPRVEDVVVELDEEDGLPAGQDDQVRILVAEETGEVADLRLRLPGARRGAEDNQPLEPMRLAEPRDRGKPALILLRREIPRASPRR